MRLGRTCSVLALALLVAALPAAASAYEPQLKRYPYLTDVVGTSATVSWATDRSATTGRISYGRVGAESCTANAVSASRTGITVNGVLEYQWRATLNGLAAGARYCYRIELGSIDLLGADPSPAFHAQLPAGSSEPFSFAVFGDWGAVGTASAGVDNRQADLMSQIAGSGVRFAVGTGDTAMPSGSQANYGDLTQTGDDISAVFAPEFYKKVGASIPLFNALGNHGNNGTFLAIWPQSTVAASSGGRSVMDSYCCVNGTNPASYPGVWYAFDAGTTRFYVLKAAWADTNPGTADGYKNDYDAHWTPSSPQYQWLENDLRTHPSRLKLAFFHYPLYSSNATEASDTYLQGTNSLEGLLARHGVDIAFNGHAHNYTRSAKPHADSLVTYVSGGGGSRLQPATRCGAPVAYAIGWSYTSGGSACGGAPRPTSTAEVFHFLRVSVNGARVTVAPTDSQGRTFDVQTYDFPADPTPPPRDTQPPSDPSGLSATAPSPNRVALSWTASTDDVGVTGYEIYRNDALLTTTSGTGTSYSDTPVARGTTYTYKVRALDAAGNLSRFSNAARVATPAGGGSAIAFVKQATGGTPTSTRSFTVPIASRRGSALVASVAVASGATTSVSSVIDSAGNRWTRGPAGFRAGSHTRIELWYTTGADPVASVTVRLSAAGMASANVSEWAGVVRADALDTWVSHWNRSSTTAATPCVATANARDLIIGAVSFPGSVSSTLASGGFTPLDDFGVSIVNGRAAYRMVSSRGSYSAAWTLSAPAASGSAILALRASRDVGPRRRSRRR
jgi:hypothetical protein